jgi:selenocysteine lyase/cysteine desulfurase
MGPKEVGLLYVRKDRIGDIWPNVIAPGWGSGVQPQAKGARKFETLGQRDDAALAAVAATVEFHRTIGAARIEARMSELAQALKSAVQAAGIPLVTPMSAALSGGVCVIQVPSEKRQEVYQKLYEKHGIAGAPTAGLRLCPHVYNTQEHIERAVAGVKALCGKS